MTRASQYVATSAIFLLGALLVTVGTAGEAQIVIFGETFPVFALVRALGLLAILASIITGLVVYGGSLPLTRHEMERQEQTNTPQVWMEGGTPPREEETARPHPDTAPQTNRSAIRLGRASTEARLRLVAESKREKEHDKKTKHVLHAA